MRSPLDRYGRYMIVQCAKCGGLSTTESRKTFKCLRCRKSTSMVKVDGKIGTHLGVKILYSSDNPQQCTYTLQEYQKQQIEKNGRL